MKKHMKRCLPVMLLASGCISIAAAQGSVSVQDKDVFEVNKAMLQQSTVSTKAVTDLNTTVKKAVTRSKTMGDTAYTKDYRTSLPKYTETSATIDAMYAQVRELGCAKPDKKSGAVLPEKLLAVCQKMERMSYDMVILLRANLEKSQHRQAAIDSLLAELDKTGPSNLKETADLSARIQVETALLQNEKLAMEMAIANNEQQLNLYGQLLAVLEEDGPGDPEHNYFSLGKQ